MRPRPLDSSYVFLPPRFGEASVLTPPRNTGKNSMGESMIGVTHSEASKNVQIATQLAMHRSVSLLISTVTLAKASHIQLVLCV